MGAVESPGSDGRRDEGACREWSSPHANSTCPSRTPTVPAPASTSSAPSGRMPRASPAAGDRSIPPCSQSRAARSEEHTSELQSLAYLVCRLLLEKKNEVRSERRVAPAATYPI